MGITAQMRRAAVSIPSNIAEGYGRESDKELLHFLYIALGSEAELDTQLTVCREVELMQDTSYQDLSTMVGEIIRMLAALINSRKLGLRKL